MNPVDALHASARRHCMARRAHWRRLCRVDEHGEHGEGPFVVVQALEMLLDEVEQLVPADFTGLDEMRAGLMLAADVAWDEIRDLFVAELAGVAVAHLPAAGQEIKSFRLHVREVSEIDLMNEEPLPHHRLFTGEERAALWAKIAHVWGVNPEEWPVIRPASGEGKQILAFDADQFDEALGEGQVPRLLRAQGHALVIELWDDGLIYEVNPEQVGGFAHPPLGKVWTSDAMNWLLGAAAEGTVVVAGDWLAGAIREAWPGWQSGLLPGGGDDL